MKDDISSAGAAVSSLHSYSTDALPVRVARTKPARSSLFARKVKAEPVVKLIEDMHKFLEPVKLCQGRHSYKEDWSKFLDSSEGKHVSAFERLSRFTRMLGKGAKMIGKVKVVSKDVGVPLAKGSLYHRVVQDNKRRKKRRRKKKKKNAASEREDAAEGNRKRANLQFPPILIKKIKKRGRPAHKKHKECSTPGNSSIMSTLRATTSDLAAAAEVVYSPKDLKNTGSELKGSDIYIVPNSSDEEFVRVGPRKHRGKETTAYMNTPCSNSPVVVIGFDKAPKSDATFARDIVDQRRHKGSKAHLRKNFESDHLHIDLPPEPRWKGTFRKMATHKADPLAPKKWMPSSPTAQNAAPVIPHIAEGDMPTPTPVRSPAPRRMNTRKAKRCRRRERRRNAKSVTEGVAGDEDWTLLPKGESGAEESQESKRPSTWAAEGRVPQLNGRQAHGAACEIGLDWAEKDKKAAKAYQAPLCNFEGAPLKQPHPRPRTVPRMGPPRLHSAGRTKVGGEKDNDIKVQVPSPNGVIRMAIPGSSRGAQPESRSGGPATLDVEQQAKGLDSPTVTRPLDRRKGKGKKSQKPHVKGKQQKHSKGKVADRKAEKEEKSVDWLKLRRKQNAKPKKPPPPIQLSPFSYMEPYKTRWEEQYQTELPGFDPIENPIVVKNEIYAVESEHKNLLGAGKYEKLVPDTPALQSDRETKERKLKNLRPSVMDNGKIANEFPREATCARRTVVSFKENAMTKLLLRADMNAEIDEIISRDQMTTAILHKIPKPDDPVDVGKPAFNMCLALAAARKTVRARRSTIASNFAKKQQNKTAEKAIRRGNMVGYALGYKNKRNWPTQGRRVQIAASWSPKRGKALDWADRMKRMSWQAKHPEPRMRVLGEYSKQTLANENVDRDRFRWMQPHHLAFPKVERKPSVGHRGEVENKHKSSKAVMLNDGKTDNQIYLDKTDQAEVLEDEAFQRHWCASAEKPKEVEEVSVQRTHHVTSIIDVIASTSQTDFEAHALSRLHESKKKREAILEKQESIMLKLLAKPKEGDGRKCKDARALRMAADRALAEKTRREKEEKKLAIGGLAFVQKSSGDRIVLLEQEEYDSQRSRGTSPVTEETKSGDEYL